MRLPDCGVTSTGTKGSVLGGRPLDQHPQGQHILFMLLVTFPIPSLEGWPKAGVGSGNARPSDPPRRYAAQRGSVSFNSQTKAGHVSSFPPERGWKKKAPLLGGVARRAGVGFPSYPERGWFRTKKAARAEAPVAWWLSRVVRRDYSTRYFVASVPSDKRKAITPTRTPYFPLVASCLACSTSSLVAK